MNKCVLVEGLEEERQGGREERKTKMREGGREGGRKRHALALN